MCLTVTVVKACHYTDTCGLQHMHAEEVLKDAVE